MEFNETQKYENYIMLMKSIEELKSGRKHTDDWEQLHFNFFSKFRAMYPDISRINPEVEDDDFRKTLHQCEQIARYLEMYWENNGTIEYRSYLNLLLRIKDIFFSVVDEDELAIIMSEVHMME